MSTLISLFMYSALSGVALSAKEEDVPKIRKFRCSETPGGFHVSGTLQKGIPRELEDAIMSGIPASVSYYLRFKHYRWYWDTKVIYEGEFVFRVTYDTLRKIFTIEKRKTADEEPFSVVTTEDAVTMRQLMSSFETDVELARNSIKEGVQYYFSMRAVVETEKVDAPWNGMISMLATQLKTPVTRLWLPVKQPDEQK